MIDHQDPATPSSSTSARSAFLGPDGLRAGWRLLIFLTIVFVLFALFNVVARPLARAMGTEFSATNVIMEELFLFAIVAIASAVMGRLEGRSFGDYGLPARGFLGGNFWIGAVWGFAMLSVIVAMMLATHSYRIDGLAISPANVVRYGLLWALAFLMVGLFEEFSFRGYLLFTLTSGLGFWPAAVISCLLFAGGHLGNPGESLVGVAEIVLIAIFLCLALRRTGNLWFAIGWHMSFDWGESFFYSTPNSGIQATGHMLKASLMGSKWLSGGSVGPEASVFDLIVTIAGILLLAKLYPDANYPATAEHANIRQSVTALAAGSVTAIITFFIFRFAYVQWAVWRYPQHNSMAGLAAFIYGVPVSMIFGIVSFSLVFFKRTNQ